MLHPSTIFLTKTEDADSRLTLSLILRFNLRLGGYTPYGVRFLQIALPYRSRFQDTMGIFWRLSGLELGDAWGLLGEDLKILRDET